MSSGQNYDLSFKQSAVDLVLKSHQSISKTAADLGVSKSTLSSWVKKYNGFPQADHLSSVEFYEKVRQLEKENRILKEERDILKKAAAYFAKNQK